MRRDLLKQRDGAEIHGRIDVDVDHLDNGDVKIVWTDNGIGMTEHIVKHYLAVAGRSYYGSDEFKQYKLPMDPISRFGIGILSCFAVADGIEIVTHRDEPNELPLRITIPSVNRQFRIEVLDRDAAAKGTTVTLTAAKDRIEEVDENDEPLIYSVFKYLADIAGFVEFPIIVRERGETHLILSPYHEGDIERNALGLDDSTIIHQLRLEYPWEDVFPAWQIEAAKTVFTEVRLDVERDLGLQHSGFKGTAVFLTLSAKQMMTSRQSSIGYIFTHLANGIECDEILLNPIRDIQRTINRVHNDGILLAFADFTLGPLNHQRNIHDWFPLPIAYISSNKALSAIDTARQTTNDDLSEWSEIITCALLEHLARMAKSAVELTSIRDAYWKMIEIITNFGLEENEICHVFPPHLCTMRLFGPNGNADYKRLKDLEDDDLMVVDNIPELLHLNIWTHQNDSCFWRGQQAVLKEIASIRRYIDVHSVLLTTHIVTAFELMHGGYPRSVLLGQIMSPKARSVNQLDLGSVDAKFVIAPNSLPDFDILSTFVNVPHCLVIVKDFHPYFNRKHRITQVVEQAAERILADRASNQLGEPVAWELTERLRSLRAVLSHRTVWRSLPRAVQEFLNLAELHGLIPSQWRQHEHEKILFISNDNGKLHSEPPTERYGQPLTPEEMQEWLDSLPVID
jgi:hypothetical protein